MNIKTLSLLGCACAAAFLSPVLGASPKPQEAPLSQPGVKLEARYLAELKALRAEIERVFPKIDDRQLSAVKDARDALKKAEAAATAAQQAFGKVHTAKALVEHAKGKWLGGARKGIAAAEAALKKATTDAERAAANKDLAKWKDDETAGLKALEERQENLKKAQSEEPQLAEANKTAQAALAQAKARESTVAKALLSSVGPVLSSVALDAKLAKCAILASATPRGLAEFAQRGREQELLIDSLLANPPLMKDMLEAGGAKFGKYGRAMEILAAIEKTHPQSREGNLRRLAIAVALEHATPVAQNNAGDQAAAPASVDPLKRYAHYEKAFLDGELDPLFKSLTTWEYRMVVDCDAPDDILAWGREMLRTYRPDHISNPDYGWRYAAAVRTEVTYGSQNVKDDLPSLHDYQNIIRNGGVCGRRAFFGRFILQSFGIPTWGVTQHKHAAVGHWTPKGWVVNLGAGFEHSWWDKDETPRSGSDFLLETQARAHSQEYWKVLRAKWASKILGEQEFNDRKGIAGGTWSSIAQYQTTALASTAVTLGPLGQELAEANEPKEKRRPAPPIEPPGTQAILVAKDGTITLPAAAFTKPAGPVTVMKSHLGGTQIHTTGGFKADYTFEIPQAGKYTLTARIATVQTGQTARLTLNGVPHQSALPIPYTIGKWQHTQPISLTLPVGKNTLQLAIQDGSRGVAIKDITIAPTK
jgi:hypothetical protein